MTLGRANHNLVGGLRMDSFTVATRERNQLVDVTPQVRESLKRRGLREGIGVVYCPHTTAVVTINENCDPDVAHDMLLWLGRAVPQAQEGFRHGEGNSDSHIKASLVGPSVSVIVSRGELILGRWQGVFLCEFDGPRTRTVQVQWVGG
jgi:secondary thiamine-phosphate synthase enzyme